MNLGDEIVYGNLDDVDHMRTGRVTKMSKELIWVDKQHRAEDCISLCYVWPIEAKDELFEIIRKRVELRKAYDDSMSLIYNLRNKIARGEIKCL